MELMAKICSATPTADFDLFWETINNAYNKQIRGKSLYEYLKENRYGLLNEDFDHNLKTYNKELEWALSKHENSEHTKIVVAGGFSSGKSSFLNRLTNSANLLPTGVEPVSVVKTYLYCSKNTRSISVKGVNQKNVLVKLNPGVLQAIQHANKSNIYLASVLDKLFVEIPSKDLNGIVFIDTPGYNNSDKANQSNGKTDRETAQEALDEGNVLFWLVDCERGTTVSNDIEFIKQFNGKKVFIFNKADKKGYQECVKIVDAAAKTLYKEFPKEEIIDIIAYSTLDNKIYCSKNNLTLSAIVKEAKKTGNGASETNYYKGIIEMLFDDEITACQNTIKSIEDNYKEKLEHKNTLEKQYRSAKEDQDTIIGELRELLIKNYNEVLSAANKYQGSSFNACNTMCEFINEMYEWDRTDHECWNNTLIPILNHYNNKHDNLCETHESIDYTWYKEEYRQSVIKTVNEEEDLIVERFKEGYDEACNNCRSALKRKTEEEKMLQDMQEYKRVYMSAIETAIRQYQQHNKARIVHEEDYKMPNVFDCIKKEDYKLFLHCFENGVDLSVCNPDGYNPLTLAVQTGNNNMVNFLLDHDADPSIKDRRGYNAFHTAVENQYRDICKMLLDCDPDLIDSTTDSGETIEELAKKQTFSKWIEQEIDNAL